jgi:hypothetical protein
MQIHAERGKLAMTSKHAATLVVLVAAIGVAVWLAGVGGSAVAPGPTIADNGIPVAAISLPQAVQGLLKDAGLATDLRLRRIAPDGVAFYTYRRSDGVMCFSADGSGVCPASGRSSLFDGAPIADVIRAGASAISGGPRPMLAWRGLALDGIASVGIIDASGVVHTAPVTDNVFELPGPIASPASFEAFDQTGKIVWSLAIDWPR